MDNFLSDRIKKLEVSQTLAMSAKVRELKAFGQDIISLSLGEPDFNTPDFIKEAAQTAINENYSYYTPVEGYLELRKAISEKFKRDNNLDYSPSQIVVSTGSKQAIYNVAQVLLNPGDECILPAPYWVSYAEIVKMAQATSIEVPTSLETNFKITPQQLEEVISPKTKMIMFNSPCNPSGSVYSKEEFKALAEVLKKYPNIFIVSDEIYEHISFGKDFCSFAETEGMYNRTITINGVSKAFAMTGWRIGYIGAPEFIAKACIKMQGQVTSGTNSIAQRATIAALMSNPEVLDYMKTEFKKRRDLVINLLQEIPDIKINVPEGTFYAFPDVSGYFGKILNGKKINNSQDLALYLLEQAKVAVISGEAFGNENCIRLSYAVHQEIIIEALKRIKEALIVKK